MTISKESIIMSDDEEEAIRSNREIVFGALQNINRPATIKTVVQYIATAHELVPWKIRAPVKETLVNGYKLGFLTKRGRKYKLEPMDMACRGDFD